MKASKYILLTALAVVSLSSCKPTEENYRKAYEATVAKSGKKSVEGTIYNRYRQQQRMTQIVVAPGDTLDVRHEMVTLTKDGGGSAETLREYNLVVAQFKQVFNAKAMCERLSGMGYQPFIMQTREPLYYVIAGSCETTAEAWAMLKKLRDDSRLSFQADCPWVLQH